LAALGLLAALVGCRGGPGPARVGDAASPEPALGVALILDQEQGKPSYEGQLALCREGGIRAARCHVKLAAPGGLSAVLGHARPVLDRLDTVMLALDPEYARAFWPESAPALERDLDELADALRGVRARVLVSFSGGRAWEEGPVASGIRRRLARLRAPGRVVAWELDVPVGPEGPPAASEAPDAPGWQRPWHVYARAIEAAAADDIDAVAVTYYPHWEAGHGRTAAPLGAYLASLRGILRAVKARGRGAIVAEYGLADRDQRFASRRDVVAGVARLARDEGALGAFYFCLRGPDFGLWNQQEWLVRWEDAVAQ
jgi:hypothetical protein